MSYIKLREENGNEAVNEIVRRANTLIMLKQYDKVNDLLKPLPDLYPEVPMSWFAAAMAETNGFEIYGNDLPFTGDVYLSYLKKFKCIADLENARGMDDPEVKADAKYFMDLYDQIEIDSQAALLKSLTEKLEIIVKTFKDDEAVTALHVLMSEDKGDQDIFADIAEKNPFLKVFWDLWCANEKEYAAWSAEKEQQRTYDSARATMTQAMYEYIDSGAYEEYAREHYLSTTDSILKKVREDVPKNVEDKLKQEGIQPPAPHKSTYPFEVDEESLPRSTSDEEDRFYLAVEDYCTEAEISDFYFRLMCHNPELVKQAEEEKREADEEDARLEQEALELKREKEEQEALAEEARLEAEARSVRRKPYNIMFTAFSILILVLLWTSDVAFMHTLPFIGGMLILNIINAIMYATAHESKKFFTIINVILIFLYFNVW